jgi:hypothetical protein
LAAGPVCRGAENTVIADKTLVAWVAPANLTQRGGSVLTIEKSPGVFDAIVFGELATSKWMAGSNTFARTKKEQESFPVETANSEMLVQIAIVYRGRQITIYRNGSQYADYTVGGAERFGQESIVLMGLRHVEAMPENRFFTGSIDDARIYNVALDAKQIAALKPNELSDPKPLAWWDFEDGRAVDRMKLLPASTLFGDARIDYHRFQQRKQQRPCAQGTLAGRPVPAGLPLCRAGGAMHALRPQRGHLLERTVPSLLYLPGQARTQLGARLQHGPVPLAPPSDGAGLRHVQRQLLHQQGRPPNHMLSSGRPGERHDSRPR